MADVVSLESFYTLFDRPAEEVLQHVGQFNLFKIEDMLLGRLKQTSYSRRNYFKASLVNGHSKIHYADRCIEIQNSALVFTNPLIPYFWERLSEQQTGYVCVFTEDFFSRFGSVKDYPVFQSPAMAIVPLTDEQAMQFRELFQKMLSELQGSYIYKYDLLRNLLMEVIHGAQKMQPAIVGQLTYSNASARIAGLFAELLERQFPIEFSNQVMTLKTPSDFAKQLAIHINHLNKALKETTGHTTTQLINNRIYQEARVLLKSTNWTVNEIAWCLGFEEPHHFSSFFKSHAQVTPRQFRQAVVD